MRKKPTPRPSKPAMKISRSAIDKMKNQEDGAMYQATKIDFRNNEAVYKIPDPPAGVVPKNEKPKLAQDESINSDISAYAYQSMYAEGLGFLGYPYLAQLSQRSEYRRAFTILAEEMTRKGIKFESTGDDDKTDLIKDIEQEFTRLRVMDNIRKALEMDYTFGVGRLYISYGESEAERGTELVASKNKVKGTPIKQLLPVEPMWTYPDQYNSTEPLDPDFYRPSVWYVMAKKVHASRFLQFCSFPVPDILKPAYLFGGVSLLQMIKPYVDNWLETRQDVQQVIHSYLTYVLKTNLSDSLAGGSGAIEALRATLFTTTKSNKDLLMLDKDTEEFEAIDAPLSGLDKLQAQALEHVCSAAGLPLVKFTGISPSGLNATSEFEMQCLNDHTSAEQEKGMREAIQFLLELVQLGLGKEPDPEITFDFVPLVEMTEKERSEIDKAESEADAAYLDRGVLSAEDVRTRLANKKESTYTGIDVNDLPEMPEPTFNDPAMDSDIMAQVEKGMKAEREHSDTVDGDEVTMLAIVLDHLKEDPLYYDKMEAALG